MKKFSTIIVLIIINSFLIKLNAQNSVIDSLENLLQKHKKQDTIRINLLNETASKLKSINIEKTLEYAIESGELADELNYKKGKAKSLQLLGIYYYYKSDYSNAIEYYQKSIIINEELNDRKEISKSLNNIGLIYYYEGNYPKSLEYYQKSIKIKEQLNDWNGISNSFSNIGLIHYQEGNYPKALEYYHKTIKLKEELEDNRGISYCLNNIGDIFTKQGDYSEALDYYQKSMSIKEEFEDNRGIAYCLNNIGNVYTKQGNYSEALEYFQKSMSIKKELGDKFGLSYSLNNTSQIYLELGSYRRALLESKKALKINEEIGNRTGICESYFKFGAIYIKTKDYNKALNYTLKSEKIAIELGLLDIQKDIFRQLSEIYAITKNYKKAYANHVLYKELNDSVFNEDNIKKITGLGYQYQYEKQKQKAELIQQKKDAINDQEIKRQKTIRNSLIVGFILMLLLVLVVLFNFLQKRKANRILKFQKDEIKNKNKVLFVKNEEIQQLNEELSSSNDQLFSQKEELKVTLNSLKEMQTKMVQSERMASVGTFTYGIAHEINNPLNYIVGGKYIIESYIKENIKEHSSELMPSIEMIEIGINRVSDIVKSLNRFSRTNFTDREECNIHSIIDNCLLTINKQTKIKVEIIKKFTDVPNIIIGNEGNLHQAILNILTNAVQAIKTTGKISIFTKIKKDNLLIQITDNGTGISKENIKKVTDPFYTSKDPGEGIGLGLSITYNIINEHSGSISFESDGKTGTTVSVRLPVEITKP